MLYVNYTQKNEVFFMFDQQLSLSVNPRLGTSPLALALQNVT
jgi:hypothetical protein